MSSCNNHTDEELASKAGASLDLNTAPKKTTTPAIGGGGGPAFSFKSSFNFGASEFVPSFSAMPAVAALLLLLFLLLLLSQLLLQLLFQFLRHLLHQQSRFRCRSANQQYQSLHLLKQQSLQLNPPRRRSLQRKVGAF
ncbi:hypothetical protein BASA62_002808 [Batrachochytrium salamandrivorans]|nr:hypothetical protein BASA62_002808 [Batrachochytrium salamandrivorans]